MLEVTAKGVVERRLLTVTTIIMSMAMDRFGVEEESVAKQPYFKNQRAVKIHIIRKELKALKIQHKAASEEERAPLAELRVMLRKRLLILRRAEQHRRRRRERAKKWAALINNPFGFTKELLGQKRSGRLDCSKVCKHCPKLLLRLWKIIKVIWKRRKKAQQWRFAEGVWIPKEEDSKNISHFRILLLSVEGKIFSSIVVKGLADFFLKKGYIAPLCRKAA